MKREKWKKVMAMLACSAVLSQGATPVVHAADRNTQLKDDKILREELVELEEENKESAEEKGSENPEDATSTEEPVESEEEDNAPDRKEANKDLEDETPSEELVNPEEEDKEFDREEENENLEDEVSGEASVESEKEDNAPDKLEDEIEGGFLLEEEQFGSDQELFFEEGIDEEGLSKEFLKALEARSAITVSTQAQLMTALKSQKSHIIVQGSITLGKEVNLDNSMKAIEIPANTTIEGRGGATLNFRAPLQLAGDHVTFKNIGLHFESSNALGSVPQREIFLAGYSLTLDNVDTYLKGSGGSLGGFGGSEAELLPVVYGGGNQYMTATMGNHAQLTIKNPNSNTVFQAIHAGGGQGANQYTEKATITLDPKMKVREGIFTDDTKATITLKDSSLCWIDKVVGNDQSTMILDGVSTNDLSVRRFKDIELKNGATFMPDLNSEINNISVASGTTLNLRNMLEARVNGNFIGGGTLRIDSTGMLTIQGTVSNETAILPEFNGYLQHGKVYISTPNSVSNNAQDNFKLADAYTYKDEFKFHFDSNSKEWIADRIYDQDAKREVDPDSVRVTGPAIVDIKDLENPQKPIEYQVFFRDMNGVDYSPQIGGLVVEKLEYDAAKEKGEYGIGDSWEQIFDDLGTELTMIGIDVSTDDYTDYNTITLEKSLGPNPIKPGKYYMVLGDYEADSDVDVPIIAEIEFTVIDVPSNGVNRTDITSNETTIDMMGNQNYTGKEIKPPVMIKHNGKQLKEDTDYVVEYSNNINVGTATVKIVGIGNYTGTRQVNFMIEKGITDLGISTDKTDYTYGDMIRFTFKATPRKKSQNYSKLAAQENEVKFYYKDNTSESNLLGTAKVDKNGQATLIYKTTDQKLPLGESQIYIDFGGSSTLLPAQEQESLSIRLSPQVIDVKTIVLENFIYDGKKQTTHMTQVGLEDGRTLSVTGKASLASPEAGSYDKATVTEWKLNPEDSKWYQLPELSTAKEFSVSPKVVIRKAPEPELVNKNIIYSNQAEVKNEDISKLVPSGYKLQSYQVGATTGDSQVVTNVTIDSTGKLSYRLSGTEGSVIIPVTVSFANHEDMSVNMNVTATSKQVVDLKVIASDMAYNGQSYNGWTVEGGSISDTNLQVTYYDIVEKEVLKAAPTNAGQYSMTVRLEDGTKLGETTKNFKITPKQVELKAINRTIKVNEEAPDLSNPQLGIDYEYGTNGGLISGGKLGDIKMTYSSTPDTTKSGSYEIRIGVPVQLDDNYHIINTSGTLTITDGTAQPNQKHTISVANGKATVEGKVVTEAKQGEQVMITADVPSGKQFVNWTTTSQDIVLADITAQTTTFQMPNHAVDIKANFRDASEVPVKGVTLNTSHLNIYTGERRQLVATVQPTHATNQGVKWSSSDNNIVTVDASGYVYAKKIGKATITVTTEEGSYTASCVVQVRNKPSSSSGGGSSDLTSSNDSSHSSSNKTSETTTKNPDGSTTTIKDDGKGNITETTKHSDGTITTIITKSDNSRTEITKKPDGSSMEETVQPNGTVVKTEQMANGLKTETTISSSGEMTADVTFPSSSTAPQKVTLPITEVQPGMVAVLVQPDGSKEIIRKSVSTSDGMIVPLSGDASLQIVDNSKNFSDVSKKDWFKDAVDFMSSRELITGTTDTQFAPNSRMTRGMLVEILHRLENKPIATQHHFNDVESGMYYSDAVSWALEAGIIKGKEGNTFAPNDAITREQLAVILYQYSNKGESLAKTTPSGLATDAWAVSDWAKDAMNWAVQTGIFIGNEDGTLRPQVASTRAEVSVVLMRLVGEI